MATSVLRRLQRDDSQAYYYALPDKFALCVKFIIAFPEGCVMPWPDHFPHNCPPDETEAANGIVYRFISRPNPKQRDFITYQELNPEMDYGENLCQACGLSVHIDLDDVIRLRRRSPAFRKKFLAKGTLTPAWGEMLLTPGITPSHHTWWVPIEKEPWKLFAKVEVPED